MNKIHFIFLILFTGILFCDAQIPVNDSAWTLQSTVSDEFTGSSLNATKWTKVGDSVPGHGDEMMYYRNVTVGGGRLKLKADTLTWSAPYVGGPHTPYHYQSGEIRSIPTYKYGYLEISAKFPTGNYLYWPAFWIWNGSCTGAGWYEEIDVCENGGNESFDKHTMGTNSLISYPVDCFDHTKIGLITGLPRLDSTFHKYALEWNPSGVSYYFDDALVRHVYDTGFYVMPYHALMVDLDFYISYDVSPKPKFNGDSLVVDYFRYYQLNSSFCLSNKTICTPGTDYSTRAVYKNITAGGSCSPTFKMSRQYTLRATDTILLDAGTTVDPDASGHFSVIIEPCSN